MHGCLDDVKVLAYLERRLARAAMAQVRSHLDVCTSCMHLVEQLTEMSLDRRARDLRRTAR